MAVTERRVAAHGVTFMATMRIGEMKTFSVCSQRFLCCKFKNAPFRRFGASSCAKHWVILIHFVIIPATINYH